MKNIRNSWKWYVVQQTGMNPSGIKIVWHCCIVVMELIMQLCTLRKVYSFPTSINVKILYSILVKCGGGIHFNNSRQAEVRRYGLIMKIDILLSVCLCVIIIVMIRNASVCKLRCSKYISESRKITELLLDVRKCNYIVFMSNQILKHQKKWQSL